MNWMPLIDLCRRRSKTSAELFDLALVACLDSPVGHFSIPPSPNEHPWRFGDGRMVEVRVTEQPLHS
jgi:hypothetical protein